MPPSFPEWDLLGWLSGFVFMPLWLGTWYGGWWAWERILRSSVEKRFGLTMTMVLLSEAAVTWAAVQGVGWMFFS